MPKNILTMLQGNLQIAGSSKGTTDQGDVIYIHVENLDDPDCLGIRIEIPVTVATAYDQSDW